MAGLVPAIPFRDAARCQPKRVSRQRAGVTSKRLRRYGLSKPTKDEAQARAEASFRRKEAQAREGKQAMAEYEAAGRAMREKTAKLRALRLAKEAAEAEAAKNAPPKPAPKSAAKPAAKGAAKGKRK